MLLAGGGSGGSAAPVIAVAEALRDLRPDTDFLYVGTRTGPERSLVAAAGFRFESVASGRLRRYLTWRNLIDPGLVVIGVTQAARLVRKFRPDVAFGAGGFATAAPLIAARALGARVMIHQQDAVAGLANRMLAPFASRISVALPGSATAFGRRTVGAIGNPVRRAILIADPVAGRQFLGLEEAIPLVLATGGGTGALGLNRLLAEAAKELVSEACVVHVTGAGKAVTEWSHPRYPTFEFLAEEFPDILAAADVVVSRSGMSSLAEIGALQKAAIVVPMLHSHQELNAAMVARSGGGLILSEEELTGARLAGEVRSLLHDPERRSSLGTAAGQLLPSGAGQRIAAELVDLVRS